MLRAGGNAIDAAVAAAWALTVCEPGGSGLGGQTVALVAPSGGDTVVVDGHSYAPAAANLASVSARQQRTGFRACTVPTTPATLEWLRRQYGSLTLPQVLEPAIQLAEEGFLVTPLFHRQLLWCLPGLKASPTTREFFLSKGQPYAIGRRFCQPRLAATLRRIACKGVEDFYQGGIARAIANDMRRNGGLLNEYDLAACDAPRKCSPIVAECAGRMVLTTPPPSGGVQILLALKLMERLASHREPPDSDPWYVRLAEVTYSVFWQREHMPPPVDTGSDADLEPFLNPERLSVLIDQMATPRPAQMPTEEPGETTHLCAADHRGNIVSLTQSIQSLFGAKVANAECGFLYNNYLITCARHDGPYQLRSGGTLRSNAAPTLVLPSVEETTYDGRRNPWPWLTLGAAGSRRITSAILQVLSRVFDQDMPLEDAVSAPRIHAKLSRKVWLEAPAARPTLVAHLEQRFRQVTVKPAWSYSLGGVHALAIDRNGHPTGAADPRREGAVRFA